MKKPTLLIAFLFYAMTLFAQEQVPANNTAQKWGLIKSLIAKAKNKVEVLPSQPVNADDTLYHILQGSTMGVIIHETGGILVDGGWIRILGSGGAKMNRSLTEWNNKRLITDGVQHAPSLLVADDAIGGFFAINGGDLGGDIGSIYYLSPDNLMLESLNLGYADFLNFCFSGNLDEFYKGLRWKNWRADISTLSGNQAFSFYPYLWSAEGKNVDKDERKIVPVAEIFTFEMDTRKQLGIK